MNSNSHNNRVLHIQRIMNMLNRAVNQHCRHLSANEDIANDIQQISYLTSLLNYSA